MRAKIGAKIRAKIRAKVELRAAFGAKIWAGVELRAAFGAKIWAKSGPLLRKNGTHGQHITPVGLRAGALSRFKGGSP
jgi:hypothetical protein